MPVQRVLSASRVLRTGGLSFNGVNNKVDIPYSPTLNPPKFSLVVWAMVKGGKDTWRSVITSRVNPPQKGYIIYAGNDNYWQFWVGSSLGWGWVVLFGPPVELNKWVFLVATYDGANMRFYVNKTLYGPKSATYIPNDTYPTRIGAGATEGSGSYYFNGLIDEVRIYNRALSQDEISRICDYNEFIRDGLVLYLDFTEGEGNIAYDKSGLGNHGTIYGAEWVVKKAKRVLSI